MERFSKQDREYVTWLEHHPHGYFLNVGRPGKSQAMLHTARCSHSYPPKASWKPTQGATKVCADQIDQLTAWAVENNLTLVACTTCKP